MNRKQYILYSLATGFIVVMLWSLLGFWGRWLCWDALVELTPAEQRTVSLSPLGLVSEEIENDPNVVIHSRVTMTAAPSAPYVSGLGMVDYVYRHFECKSPPGILDWDDISPGWYARIDRNRGLIEGKNFEFENGSGPWKRVRFYIGPDGVAESPSQEIGRFHSPVIGQVDRDTIVFDGKRQRFFDVSDGKVVEGPPLSLDDSRRPVQIGVIGKHSENLVLTVDPPFREVEPNEPTSLYRTRRREDGMDLTRMVHLVSEPDFGLRVPVLEASGRIRGLNGETLELTGSLGWLAGAPEAFVGSSSRVEPRALSAYTAMPIFMRGYIGCVFGALNHDGSQAALAVFDEAGTRIASTMAPMVVSSPLVSTIRFGLENLHCPALLLASYFTAPYCPGGSGYRSIFVQPDSLIAKKGRDLDRLHIYRFLEAVVLVIPGILLAGALSLFVLRRGRRIGLSGDVRLAWVIATMAFGVPAYLTYRLTEPRERLVTCRNCGKLRRPDRDRCHQCQSPWYVPDLVAPAWRVLDVPQEEPSHRLSAPAEQESTQADSTAD